MQFLPFILKRAIRNWRMLLVVAFGVILSTGLLSSAPILVNTVVELGLPVRLKSARPIDANLRISTYENINAIDYRDIDEPLQALIQTRFAGHVDRIVLSISTHWMHPWSSGALLANERINFRYFEALRENVDLVAGEWPVNDKTGANTDGLPLLDVVTGESMAEWYGVGAGDEILLSTTSASTEPSIVIRIAAVVRPKIPADPYWLGSASPFVSQANQRYTQQYSVMVPHDTFFEISRLHFPRSNSEIAWHVLLNQDTIQAENIPRLINTLASLQQDLGSNITYKSDLQNILLGYYTQSQGIRIPLFLLTAEIVLLALVYVVMTASLSVRMISREFAVLRSRGATKTQLFRIQFTEAILIAIVAWISGPGTGGLLIRLLGRFGPLIDLAGSELAADIPPNAWTAAFIGAAAGIAGLLLPVGPALKSSVVLQDQSTGREKPPVWQRLYLDVMLLALGLILLFRLQLYGGLTTGRVDWLLLLAPLTILLGAATLVVRIAPPMLAGMSRIAAAGRGLSAPLAFWQTARNSSQFAGLVILLTLANALGVLATGLNATLNASEIERSRYAAGSDIRLQSSKILSLNDFTDLPGVEKAVGVWRSSGTINLKNYRSFPTFDLLAIDPQAFTGVTGYRHDFSEEPMGEVLGTLLTKVEAPGLQLAGQPDEIGMWVYALPSYGPASRPLDGSSDTERLGYFAKLFTAGGESFEIEMKLAPLPGPDENREVWGYVYSELPQLKSADYPLVLHSIWFRNRAKSNGQFVVTGGIRIFLDNITVTDSKTGEETVVEGFEDVVEVIAHELRGAPNAISNFAYTKQISYTGESSVQLFLSYTRALSDIGVVFNIADRENTVIPAVVSRRFLEATDLAVGDRVETFIGGQAIQFEIMGTVNYFPTLYETGAAGFLITSSNSLLTRLSNETSRQFSFNEVLLQTNRELRAGELSAASRSEISETWDAENLRKLIKADPMSLGLRGVTFLGYFLTSIMSIVGFSTFFYLSIRARAHSFSILRAMGLSPRQLYISLAIEQGLVILTGLSLGALLGAFLNDLVLPGLPVTLGDSLNIPPFVPRADWRSVGQVFFTLIITFVLAFGATTWALWKSRVHEALRYE